jgi:hypothetical protein
MGNSFVTFVERQYLSTCSKVVISIDLFGYSNRKLEKFDFLAHVSLMLKIPSGDTISERRMENTVLIPLLCDKPSRDEISY